MSHQPAPEYAAAIKDIVLREFLADEDPESLLDSTPLIQGGVLDSISLLRFAGLLEERFAVTIDAHEFSIDYMNTINDIARLIESKVAKA